MKNYTELEQQANQYAEQQLRSKNSKITQAQILDMQNLAAFLYQQKDCRLASELQRKSIQYLAYNDSNSWYNLSLYAACNNNFGEAAKAIYLAYKHEANVQQQIIYLQMLSDYLYSNNQRRSSWTNDLIQLYKQLQVSSPDGLVNKNYTSKITSLINFQKSATQLKISSPRIDTYQHQLKICMDLNLNDYWSDKEYQFEDYFRFQPAFNLTFEKNYGQLCVLGANWSQNYQLQILKGLGIENKTLDSNLSFNFKTPARASSYWFQSNRYLLSSSGESQVPLYAVNTPQVHLSLYHITEENLQNQDFIRNFQNKLSADDIQSIIDNLGNKIWNGDVQLNQKLDQHIISQIPIPSKHIQTNGIYVLVATDDEKALQEASYYERFAAQWIIVSDIGLAAYKGNNGLTLMAHSLSSGKSLADVSFSVLSQNNSKLAGIKTDSQGRGFIDRKFLLGKAGKQAISLIGHHPEHGFIYFPLNGAAFDLSDRGVSGRKSPGMMEAFLYTERGIYRPGERINMTALLRDKKARAIQGLPLTLQISNPDGIVVREEVLQAKSAGAYEFQMISTLASRTGRWKMALFADVKQNSIGEVSFQIEEIIPPRLEVTIKPAQGALYPNETKPILIQADYLYGAPGAELNTRLDVSFENIRQPFSDYQDYFFGFADGAAKDKQLGKKSFNFHQEAKTDAKGLANISIELPAELDIKNPIQAKLRAEVEDVDGRASADSTILTVWHLPLYIGLDPGFKERAPEHQTFHFKLLTLNQQIKPIARPDLYWRLIKEEQYYQWFYKSDQWAYEKIVEEKIHQDGLFNSQLETEAQLEFNLAQGDYRLDVMDKKLSIGSSYRFSVGEQVKSEADSPDVVKLTLDKPAYKAGEIAQLNIQSPYTGFVDIVIANDKVLDIIQLNISDPQSQINIPVKQEWGTGVYALLSVYRGTDTITDPRPREARLPERAIGVAWINMDKRPYQLDIELASPKKILPRQEVNIPIMIKGVQSTEDVFVTLAAVDSGVLNLTAFASPDPLKFFLDKRKLEVALKDNYGRLIDTISGKPGRLRQGGDSPGRAAAPAKNIKILSRFSGIVKIDAEGKANIKLDIPEFNGRVRLMAIAWTESRLGATSKAMTIADKVVLMPSLPRFLAHGDEAQITVLVQNLNGPNGDYQLQLQGDDLLQVITNEQKPFQLRQGERRAVKFNVQAKQLGNGLLNLSLIGPEDYKNQQTLNIGIRGLNLPNTQEKMLSLKAGQELLIDNADMLNFYPSSVQKTVTINSGLNMDVPELLAKLDRYPHGCLEQLSSRLTPLLDLENLAQRWDYQLSEVNVTGKEMSTGLDIRIEQALGAVLDKQRYDGGFGLWSSQDRAEHWLTSYVMELLLVAKQKNHKVPEFFIKRGIGWLNNFIGNSAYEDKGKYASLAYAHYVLAQFGQGKVEEARYFAKQYASELPSLLAYAQLAQALALMGELGLAEEMIKKVQPIEFQRKRNWSDYGSRLRDMAGFAALVNSKTPIRLAKYEQALQWLSQEMYRGEGANKKMRYLSTQEQAWLIRLANTLGTAQPLDLSIDDKPIQTMGKDSTSLIFKLNDLFKAKRLQNKAKNDTWYMSSTYGQPIHKPAYNNGFEIDKQIYDLDGQLVDLQKIKQGDRLIIVLQGRATTGSFQRPLIVDLLPAGLELENTNLANSAQLSRLNWLPSLTELKYSEALDDRYIAAFEVANGKQQNFVVAYPVRAVTQGSYGLPGVDMEDMYQPYFRANSEADLISIK